MDHYVYKMLRVEKVPEREQDVDVQTELNAEDFDGWQYVSGPTMDGDTMLFLLRQKRRPERSVSKRIR